MNLDLRIPMGLMFTLVGLILTVFGLSTMGDPMYARSLGINANLDWGIVLLIFGSFMSILGRVGQKKADKKAAMEPAKPAAEGTVRRGH
jgi:hypothetical protein